MHWGGGEGKSPVVSRAGPPGPRSFFGFCGSGPARGGRVLSGASPDGA